MNGNNSIIWIIIIVALFCGNGCFGNLLGNCGNSCNSNDCSWIIILIILFCCCGNNSCFNLCDNNCSC